MDVRIICGKAPTALVSFILPSNIGMSINVCMNVLLSTINSCINLISSFLPVSFLIPPEIIRTPNHQKSETRTSEIRFTDIFVGCLKVALVKNVINLSDINCMFDKFAFYKGLSWNICFHTDLISLIRKRRTVG